jgi:hypothetical protein
MDEQSKPMTLRDTIAPKSDQLNYDDLVDGPRTYRVTGLSMGTPEQPVLVQIADAITGEPTRPYKPCKTMRRVLIAAWGDKGKAWIGKSLTLYGEPSVKFGGDAVGGIRVSHVSGIDKPLAMKLTTAKGKRSDFVVAVIAKPEGGAA